jgi:hypothetical protein
MNMEASLVAQALPLCLTLASILVVVLLFLRRIANHGLSETQQRLLATKYVLFNSLYTFFLTLAVITLLSSYNQAKVGVHGEAESLLFMHRVSAYLDGSGPFRETLESYTLGIVEDDWPLLSEGRLSARTDALSQGLWKALEGITPRDAKQIAVFQELVRELGTASKSRMSRTLYAKGHLFPLIRVVIWLGFVLCFVQFFHTSLPQRGVQAAYDFVVLAMLAMVILVLHSLDQPFGGMAKISPEPFLHALSSMRPTP